MIERDKIELILWNSIYVYMYISLIVYLGNSWLLHE